MHLALLSSAMRFSCSVHSCRFHFMEKSEKKQNLTISHEQAKLAVLTFPLQFSVCVGNLQSDSIKRYPFSSRSSQAHLAKSVLISGRPPPGEVDQPDQEHSPPHPERSAGSAVSNKVRFKCTYTWMLTLLTCFQWSAVQSVVYATVLQLCAKLLLAREHGRKDTIAVRISRRFHDFFNHSYPFFYTWEFLSSLNALV